MRNLHIISTAVIFGVVFVILGYLHKPNTDVKYSPNQEAAVDLLKEFYHKNESSINSHSALSTEEIAFKQRLLQQQSLNYSDFSSQIFSGTWNSTPQNPFGYFSGSSGNILLEVVQNQFSQYSYLNMVLYDPQYDDGKRIFIQFTSLNLCDQGNLTWSCTQTASVKEQDMKSLQNSLDPSLGLLFEMSIINHDAGLSPENVQISLTINQPGISTISATLTYDTSSPALPFLFYNLFICAFGIQQLISINSLTNQIQTVNHAYSTKLSMLTIGFIIVYDSYTSLAHLYMALEYTSYFYYFIVPTMIYFVMTTIIDMKLLIIIWKNRYYIYFETPAQVRKGFAIFYAKFYFSLIVFFTLTYQFYLYNEYLMIFPLFMVPQIVHNYLKGNSPLYSHNFLLGTLLSRVIIPVYFRGCPENIRNLTPCLWFSITYPLVFVLFIAILYAQIKFGPRFFVPRRFKGGYNYYRNFQTSDPALMDDCPICMSKLKFEPEDEVDESYSSDGNELEPTNGKLLKKKKIVVTQCNHLYHVSCFKAWINIKLECPSCRQALQPLFD